MDIYAVLIICGSAVILGVYALRTLSVQVLSNRLAKESNALRLEINKGQRMLREYEDTEPEEIVSRGLSSAGLGEMLKGLDKTAVEGMLGVKIPDTLWSLAQGYLSKAKPAGGVQNVEKSHPRQ